MEDQLLAILGIALVPVTSALTALWIAARRRAHRAEAALQQIAVALAARGAVRGADLGETVDAMAFEMERMAEVQRRVTELLEVRSAHEVAPATQAWRVTPH